MRLVDDLEQALLRQACVRDDQLVERVRRECMLDLATGLDLVDEEVVDPTSPSAERRPEVRTLRSVTDDHGAATYSDRVQSDSGDRLVARTQNADRRGDEHRGDDVQPEGREVLTGADRENQRQSRHEEDRRHDATRPLAHLARGIQTGLPEHEHQQQDQERKPIGLVRPEQAPEHGLRLEQGGAERERRVEAEDQPADVDRREDRNADETTAERAHRRTRQEVGTTRPHILDDRGRFGVKPWTVVQNGPGHAPIVLSSPAESNVGRLVRDTTTLTVTPA